MGLTASRALWHPVRHYGMQYMRLYAERYQAIRFHQRGAGYNICTTSPDAHRVQPRRWTSNGRRAGQPEWRHLGVRFSGATEKEEFLIW